MALRFTEAQAAEAVRQYAAEYDVPCLRVTRVRTFRTWWLLSAEGYQFEIDTGGAGPAFADVQVSLRGVVQFEFRPADSGLFWVPPWGAFPTYSSVTIGWRMGEGEDYLHSWYEWFNSLSDGQRAAYRRRFPEPERDAWPGFYDWRTQPPSMDEQAWLNGMSPAPMLGFVEGKASERKARLFACACCRRVWDRLSQPRSREAVEAAEHLADGLITPAQAARLMAEAVRPEELASAVWAEADEGRYTRVCDYTVARSALALKKDVLRATHSLAAAFAGDRPEESRVQCDLMRDVFGNPFRTPSFSPEWRTETTVGIAERVYEAREFGNLPVLADALMDAGCDSEEILSHCRGDGPHVRGCWVVDLVLGKS